MTIPVQDTPAYQRPEAVAMRPHLHLIDDLCAGTSAMHEHALDREYIRKWKREDPVTYGIRSTMATCFEGLQRVLTASVGMVLGTPPVLEAPVQAEVFAADWDDLDGAGTRGDVLLTRFATLMLKHGAAAIVVDHPQPPEGVPVTEANEAELGLKPTWAVYPRESIRAWRIETLGGRRGFTLLIFGEVAQVPSGLFGVREAVRYRVLQLLPVTGPDGVTRRAATWTLFEERKTETGETVHVRIGAGLYTDRAGQPFDTLPVALDPALLEQLPPLLGVANANLSHFRKKTDLAFYEALCAFPQPTVIGSLANDPRTGKPMELAFGPTVAIVVNDGGDYRMTELQGTSLAQLRESLQAAVQEMAAMGLSFLVRDSRAAETAEGKRIDNAAEQATLSVFAQAIEDAANVALMHHARYRGVATADAPTLTLSRDFTGRTIDAAGLSAVVQMVKEGFPEADAVKLLEAARILTFRDAEDRERLIAEWQGGTDARASAAALEAGLGQAA